MHPHLLKYSEAMQTVCPSVFEQLKTHYEANFSSYLKALWQKPISCSSKIALASRSKFYGALRQFFAAHSIDFDLAISEFERFPILQTGPHCQLYTNSIDFNALLISWMGAQLHQLKHAFLLNSATRTLQWSKNQGPGWINLKQETLNLFDLTQKQMSKLSVCTAYPDLTFNLTPFTQYLNKASANEKKGLEKLLSIMEPKKYDGFISAFGATNQNLINLCDEKQEVKPLIVNDYFTSLLVMEHLQDPQDFLHQLIFCPLRRNKLNQLFHSLTQNRAHIFLKQGTEYFWGMRANRIRAMKVEGEFLVEEQCKSTEGLKIPLESKALCEALKKELLIPNIFLSFLVFSLLPQIRVLGGTRQIAYLPLIQKIVCDLLNPHIPEEQELLQELSSNDLNAWGTNLIQDDRTPLECLGQLPLGKEFSSLSKHYFDKSLIEITQELIIFKDHPLWKHML